MLCSCGLTAQSLAYNTTDKDTGNRFVITRNSHSPSLRMDDSVAKYAAVFFAVGCQTSKPGGKQLETYYIELDIIHNDNRIGCLQELTGKILLELEDGTTIECFQISPSDCDKSAFKAGYAMMKRSDEKGVMKANLQKLITTEIEKIKVFTTEKELEYVIKSKDKELMKKHFALVDKTISGK